MASEIKASLSGVCARLHASVHTKSRRPVWAFSSAAATCKKFRMNFRECWHLRMNRCISLALADLGISTVMLILLGRAGIPPRVTKRHNYFTSWPPKAQFPGCSYKLAFRSASKTRQR